MKTQLVKTVTFSELTKDNPILCLSVLRQFEDCHKCFHSKHGFKTQLNKCKPRIKTEIKKLLEEKRILLNDLNEINKKVEL